MTALTLHPTTPPPGAPPHWGRMPWHARQQWISAQRRAARTAAPAPVEEPPVLYDEQGRRIWTDQQMRAAMRAYEAHRTKGGPELTPDQQDAYRAYLRQRRAQKQQPPKRAPWPREQVLARVVELTATGASPLDICAALGKTANAVAKALERCDRHDLAGPYNRLRGKERTKAHNQAGAS